VDTPPLEPCRAAFYASVGRHAEAAAAEYARWGVSAAGAFVGFRTMGCDLGSGPAEGAAFALRLWRSLAGAGAQAAAAGEAGGTGGLIDPGLVEWMVHPGYPSPPPSGPAGAYAAGCGHGPDAFSCSRDRRLERDVLTDPALRALLRGQAQEQGLLQLVAFGDPVIESGVEHAG
jgi:hypothetical protein